MKKINWIVRIKNKAFWVALIPALLLLVQAIAAVFGLNINLGDLGDKLLTVINALFAVLAILGVVVDPTTPGTGDSERALTYKTFMPRILGTTINETYMGHDWVFSCLP